MSEEVSYQTDPVEQVEEVQQEPIEQPSGDSQPQEEPKGLTVKYDKEEKFLPEEEARELAQMGLYYKNKVQTKIQDYETKVSTLDKLAKIQGYQSTDDFLQAVQQHEQQQQIEQEAARLGMDVEQFQQYVNPINQELKGTKDQVQQLQNQLFQFQVEREVIQLQSKYPDFEQHKDQVFKIADDLRLPPDKLDYAYKLATYENLGRQAEQQAIKKLQDNAATTPGSLGQDNPDEKFSFSSLSPSEKSAFIEKVKRGEITHF